MGPKTTLMKGKLLLLLGIGFVPLALTGQTTPYLYNKGTMSVVTGNNANTALYIGGDFISEAGTTANPVVMHLTKAKVVLTGDLYRYGSATSTSHVFNVNDYTGYNTAANQSSLVFRNSTKAQRVWKADSGLNPYNAMDFTEKANNAIYFPNIVIENKNHVTIHPEIGASAYNVKPVTGRLILDSRKFGEVSTDALPSGTSIHNSTTSSILAHLLVKGKQDMDDAFDKETDPIKPALDEYGGVQVNLALDTPPGEPARRWGSPIFGMGVPFKTMRADYFMFNFLFMPSGNSIFNADGNTSVDPLLELKAGQGFVIGVDLRGSDASAYTDIHPFYKNNQYGYQIDFSKRVTEKYRFNRFAYGMHSNNLFQVATAYTSTTAPVGVHRNDASKNVKPSGSAAYTAETLYGGGATPDDVVTRTLVKGYNYLSNPFTCPLDIRDLVFNSNDNGTVTAIGWGVKPGFTGAGSSAAVGDIANRVWVMDPASVASGTYDLWSGGTVNNPGNKWVVAHYKYRLISKVGSTNPTTYDNGSGVLANGQLDNSTIAPLQMFLVYANKNIGITIPASARTVESNALFLRSSGDNKYEPDDFLFEVEDLDKGTKDRAAIVLRTFSEINKVGYSDIPKLTTDVSSNEDGKTKASTSEGTVKTSGMSALYTKNSDGTAIESKFLAMDLGAANTSTILYLQPSLTKHDITIRSFRNYTKDRITEIVLEDLLTKKTIKLSDGAVYKTSSSPKDDPARFRLTFKYSPVGGIGDDDDFNSDQTSITAYYANNTLTVSGFNDSDYGSQVSVYDIQGRLIKQRKVEATSVEFNDGFTVGAYIVKVTGSRSYATKFLAR